MMDDTLQVMEQNSRRSMELLKKAGDVASTMSCAELQQKLQSLWEESLQLLRSNTAAVVEVNNRALDTWMELVQNQAEKVRSQAAA